jgi:hypothetical protein
VLLLEIVIMLLLLLILKQDLENRAVYWIIFPVLALALIARHYLSIGNIALLWQPILVNAGFLLLQFVLVSVYFSLKHKKLIRITDELLGLGDILFLLSIALYLSVMNFLVYYMFSLIVVLIFWLVWHSFSTKKRKEIPLAGFQAMIFILFLAGDWWGKLFDLTDDTWLLNLIGK